MQVLLIGIHNLDFTASDSSPVKGTQLFVAYDEDGVAGKRTDKFFLKDGFVLPPELKPGNVLDIAFNHRGKTESIRIIPQK